MGLAEEIVIGLGRIHVQTVDTVEPRHARQLRKLLLLRVPIGTVATAGVGVSVGERPRGAVVEVSKGDVLIAEKGHCGENVRKTVKIGPCDAFEL